MTRHATVSAFGKEFGYAQSTLRKWCAEGMPHFGYGRARRIPVEPAKAWIHRHTNKSSAPMVVVGELLQ